MNEWMVFADRIKKEMERQGLSYRQLADKMEMTTTTIFRYAKGQRIPRANEILKAANALGVTCDYLLGLVDEPHITAAQPELIESRAYVRGFEQGRTQGMIDAQERKK